jgi:hypothetical protein
MTDPEQLPKHAEMLFQETALTVTDHDGLVVITIRRCQWISV